MTAAALISTGKTPLTTSTGRRLPAWRPTRLVSILNDLIPIMRLPLPRMTYSVPRIRFELADFGPQQGDFSIAASEQVETQPSPTILSVPPPRQIRRRTILLLSMIRRRRPQRLRIRIRPPRPSRRPATRPLRRTRSRPASRPLSMIYGADHSDCTFGYDARHVDRRAGRSGEPGHVGRRAGRLVGFDGADHSDCTFGYDARHVDQRAGRSGEPGHVDQRAGRSA